MPIAQPTASLEGLAKRLRLALENKNEVHELKKLDPEIAARINDQITDTGLKKLYAYWFIGVLIAQLFVMNGIFIAVGLSWLNFQDSTHLNLFMGGTLAEVFGIVLVITRYLFSKK